MKGKTKKIFILSLIILTVFTLRIAAFDMEQKIIYDLPRGSTLEDAFRELEKISNDYYVFYFDPEVNLSEDFRLAAREETFESVLNLILYVNELEVTKISTQLYYVYPSFKKEEIEKELNVKVPFKLAGIVHGVKNVATLKYNNDVKNVLENDVVMGYVIKSIGENSVTLEKEGKEYTIYLHDWEAEKN